MQLASLSDLQRMVDLCAI